MRNEKQREGRKYEDMKQKKGGKGEEVQKNEKREAKGRK